MLRDTEMLGVTTKSLPQNTHSLVCGGCKKIPSTFEASVQATEQAPNKHH